MNQKIVTILTIIGFIFTAFFVLETRHASSGMVSKMNKRLENKILSDQLHDVRKEMREIRKQYYNDIITDAEDREEFYKLSDKKEDLETLINNLLKEKK